MNNKDEFVKYCERKGITLNKKQYKMVNVYFSMRQSEGKTFLLDTLRNFEIETGW